MARPPLGAQEMGVLGYVAEHAPITVGEVAERFSASHGLARTTILTVIERLRRKGYLKRRKVEGVYRYSPTIPTPDLLRSLVSDFAERVLGGSPQPFLAYLLEEAELGDGEVAELRKLVREMETKRKGGRS
jgi:predicted transcriptional regulator